MAKRVEKFEQKKYRSKLTTCVVFFFGVYYMKRNFIVRKRSRICVAQPLTKHNISVVSFIFQK